MSDRPPITFTWVTALLGSVAWSFACSPDPIHTADVVTISACPSGSCTGVADGESRIRVKTCISDRVDAPKTDLKATLSTTLGAWIGAAADSPASVDVAFGLESCVSRDLRSPLEAGTATVVSELAGYRAETQVTFEATVPERIELTPQPAFLDPKSTTTVILNIVVRTATGKPTIGTAVRVTVAGRDPAGAAVTPFPSTAVLDDKQTASVSLAVAPGTKSVSIKVETLSAPPIEETLTLPMSSASAQGDAGN